MVSVPRRGIYTLDIRIGLYAGRDVFASIAGHASLHRSASVSTMVVLQDEF